MYARDAGTLVSSRRRLASVKLAQVSMILLAVSLHVLMVPSAIAQDSSTGVVTVQISTESVALTAAEWVQFDTLVSNNSTTVTPPLAAHLSIAGLDKGQHVDPEDWSPERTQFLPPLEPGESVRLTWWLHALFEGALISFVTVVSPQESFPAIVSSPLRLQVAPDNILPLKEVVFVVAAVPLFPLTLLIFAAAHNRGRRWLELVRSVS